MSLTWKIITWTVLVITIISTLEKAQGFVFIYGCLIIAICVKLLKSDKNTETKNKIIKKVVIKKN